MWRLRHRSLILGASKVLQGIALTWGALQGRWPVTLRRCFAIWGLPEMEGTENGGFIKENPI